MCYGRFGEKRPDSNQFFVGTGWSRPRSANRRETSQRGEVSQHFTFLHGVTGEEKTALLTMGFFDVERCTALYVM